VICLFVKQHGQDVAERYLLHNYIESYRVLLQYKEFTERLNLEPATPEEEASLAEIRSELLKKYGKEYGTEYGWAAAALGKQRPKFVDLETAVPVTHLRPYYKMASHGVHAGPKGVLFDIGIPQVASELMLAGPSNAGLADPGHCAAISLAQISSALLLHQPTPDRVVLAKALSLLEKEIGADLLASHRVVEARSAEQATRGRA
jgi:hypothetical protein